MSFEKYVCINVDIINHFRVGDSISIGTIYLIDTSRINPDFYILRDDHGQLVSHHKVRFISLTEYRRGKIKEILG